MGKKSFDHLSNSSNKTTRFLSFSFVLHASLAAAVGYFSFMSPKAEKIEVQFESSSPAASLSASNAAPSAPLSKPPDQAPKIKKAQLPTQTLPAKAVASKDLSSSQVQSDLTAPSIKLVKDTQPSLSEDSSQDQSTQLLESAKAAQPLVTETVSSKVQTYDVDSEIEVPAIEEDLTEASPQETSGMGNEDFEEGFQNLDQQHDKQLAALNEEMKSQSQQQMKALAADLAAAKAQIQQEDQTFKKVAGELQSKRQKELQEKAQTSKGSSESSSGQSSFGGNGFSAAKTNIRALEDLRQMPGNKRPQYDIEDRLKKRQGEITFIAYINKLGYPAKFELLSSTGHRELDQKTLAALKSWRFYPGQEGWVEIPFKWDLKGGVQEKPTPLRRKVGFN
jgi:TonB family protein